MSRRGGRGGHTIAGAALRNAGLVGDGDVGMRDAAGPSRSRSGRAGGRGGGRNSGNDPSNSVSHPDHQSSTGDLIPPMAAHQDARPLTQRV